MFTIVQRKRFGASRLGVALVVPLLFGTLSATSQETNPPDAKEKTGTPAAQAASLGVMVERAEGGKLEVTHVEPGSPAARAGLRAGDLLVSAGGAPLGKPDDLRAWLLASSPGQTAVLVLERAGKQESAAVTLGTPSRPFALARERSWLGAETAAADGEGARVKDVLVRSPAAAAGIKPGDVLLQLDDAPIRNPGSIEYLLLEREPRTTVRLRLRREAAEVELAAVLRPHPAPDRLPWDPPRPTPKGRKSNSRFKGGELKLGVVPVAFSDAALNPKITTADWREQLFSKGTYTKKNATGQAVFGSLNDYFQEVSRGKLKLTGTVFEPVKVPRKMDYYLNSVHLAFEVSAALEKREGKEALKPFDAYIVIYAGPLRADRVYTPHAALSPTPVAKGADGLWEYILVQEGGPRMTSISVLAHEVGHVLGLPDLYADASVENAGRWCTMAAESGPGKPVHYCAWSKEQLGWLTPTVIDPAVKQKLVLRPVSDGPRECLKIPLGPDDSEYLLLENRSRKGFDRDLPGEGLLVWRVRDRWPVLEESHGIPGPVGPRVFQASVPYPSAANDSFTPYTTPSSRPSKPGGKPVHITNIRRLPDGSVSLWVGYEVY